MSEQRIRDAMNNSTLTQSEEGGDWVGRWNGQFVRISAELVQSIREGHAGEALQVGPDSENFGMWIATTTPDGWMSVPEVRVWYRYEDFVAYVKQRMPGG